MGAPNTILRTAYQLVKDLRTNVESTNPDNVLDGNIDKFIEAALANRINN